LIFGPLFAVIFAFNLNMGLIGVWWGMVTGNILGSLFIFGWARFYVSRLLKYGNRNRTSAPHEHEEFGA
jgi:Na+-driven multidrug efflux pump